MGGRGGGEGGREGIVGGGGDRRPILAQSHARSRERLSTLLNGGPVWTSQASHNCNQMYMPVARLQTLLDSLHQFSTALMFAAAVRQPPLSLRHSSQIYAKPPLSVHH